jgi:hypothetical protein
VWLISRYIAEKAGLGVPTQLASSSIRLALDAPKRRRRA